ncbi:hypothetical protein G6F40_015731 [Rhizopus arrhizus]|nr:hypothetical protein G6F40_015731 [Rhizopus arrhizus]
MTAALRAREVAGQGFIEATAIGQPGQGIFAGLPLERLGLPCQALGQLGLFLVQRLQVHGHDYADFPAHNGLWEMCEKTAHDGLARRALVPRVLEARGLDVTPGMIEKLRNVGDGATADVLEVILREEVAHVAAGSRWYRCTPAATCMGRSTSKHAGWPASMQLGRAHV